MKIISHCFSIILFTLYVLSCSAGEEYEQDVLDTKSDTAPQVQYEEDEEIVQDELLRDDLQYGDTEEGDEIEPLPRIESLRITSVSDQDVRSGFKIDARTNVEDFVISEYFKVLWMHNGEELLGETEETLNWIEEFKKGDKIKVVLIPTLEDIESPLVNETEFVIPNSAPSIISEPPSEIKDGKFEYTVEAEDPDGDDIEFQLKKSPKGMTIEPASGLISWDFTKEKPGTEYKIEIVASDTEGLSYTQELTLTIPEDQPEQQDGGEEEGAQ